MLFLFNSQNQLVSALLIEMIKKIYYEIRACHRLPKHIDLAKEKRILPWRISPHGHSTDIFLYLDLRYVFFFDNFFSFSYIFFALN